MPLVIYGLWGWTHTHMSTYQCLHEYDFRTLVRHCGQRTWFKINEQTLEIFLSKWPSIIRSSFITATAYLSFSSSTSVAHQPICQPLHPKCYCKCNNHLCNISFKFYCHQLSMLYISVVYMLTHGMAL